MKRTNVSRMLAGVLSIVLLGSALAGCSQSSGGQEEKSGSETYTFRMANVAAPDDVQYISFEYFAKILAERSNGRIEAIHYGNSAVGGSNQEQTEMVIEGSLEYTTTPGFVLSTLNSNLAEFNVFDFPYLFLDTEELNRYFDSDLCTQIREEAQQELNVYIKPAFNMGWYIISSNQGPIAVPDDIKGQKIRSGSSEIYIKTLNSWNCSPATVNYSELYTALQQGTIDGMTTLAPLYIYQKFYEVQKYMGVVNYASLPHWPVINKEWYDSLPDDLKEVFDECFDEYLAYTRELHAGVETSALEDLEELGMTVTIPDEEQKQLWVDAVLPIWDEMKDFTDAEYLGQVREFLGR